jgi:hypothetical protein
MAVAGDFKAFKRGNLIGAETVGIDDRGSEAGASMRHDGGLKEEGDAGEARGGRQRRLC